MSKFAVILSGLCLAVAGHAQAVPGCEPLPGVDALWSKRDVRFVLVGELHGTVESPAIFRDLVCAATQGIRPVIVGIERNPSEQKAIDAFLAKENHEGAVRALLAQPGWNTFDGRSSRAMLALLEDLRTLMLKGEIVDVVAFADTRDGETPAQTEQRMAALLTAAGTHFARPLVIALVGNVHASKKLIDGYGSYPFMGMRLRPAQTVSLFVTDQGGDAWNWMTDGCRPHSLHSTGGTKRGLTLAEDLAPYPGFDGVLSTGLTASASPPAAPNPPPPPACTKK